MAASARGGKRGKDGNMGGGGASRGRGNWGRGGGPHPPHMNQNYSPGMSPNMRPMGPPQNGQPSYLNLAQSGNGGIKPNSPDQNRPSGFNSLGSHIGSRISVSINNGQRFEGLLSSVKPEINFTLENAKDLKVPGAALRPQLIIMMRDLQDWKPLDVVNGGPSSVSTFRTDADIASQASVRERDLQGPGAWANDMSTGLPPLPSFQDTPPSAPPVMSGPMHQPTPSHSSAKSVDDMTFGAGSAGGWDQFAANEKLFGVTTSFDEELYTTKLDRTASDFKEKERKAQKLADEIQGITSSNPHLAEERGTAIDDSGINEEDKYGAVVRNPNVYIPPGARRAGVNGTPLPSRVLTPKPVPATSSPATTLATVGNSAAPAAAASATGVDTVTAKAAIPTVSINAPDDNIAGGDKPATDSSKGSFKLDLIPEFKAASTVPSANVSPTPSATPSAPAVAADLEKPTRAQLDNNPLMTDFRNFVAGEKERLTTTRKTVLKLEKDKRIADLIRFSSTFKLNKEVPEDLVNIMTKDDGKRKAIIEKSKEDARATGARAIGIAAGSIPTSGSSRVNLGLAQAANAVKSPLANAVGFGQMAASSTSTAAPAKPVKLAEKFAIPVIPPFNANKSKPAAVANGRSAPPAPDVTTKVDQADKVVPTAAQNAAKLNINASSFKPNVNAPSFKPVNGASSSSSRPPPTKPKAVAPTVVEESNSAISQPNPFFGGVTIKKTSVHIKDEFSPFKHSKVAEAPSIAFQWPYMGKKYISIFPAQPAAPAPPPVPTPYEEDTQAQVAQAQAYTTMMFGYPPYHRYPGQPQPGHPQMSMPGSPNGFMPPPQFMPMHYPPPMHGGPPQMYGHPMMSPMPPPGAQYMQPGVPGPYPGPPTSNGGGRGSIPQTPLPPHAHAYAYHQSPAMTHGVPYQMMMPPNGPPNGPPMPYDGAGPPVPMVPH